MPRSLEGTLEARSSAVSVVLRDDDLERSVRYHRIVRCAVRLGIEGALLVALVSLFFLRFPQVEGRSMQPNIEQGYHVLINTLAYDAWFGPWHVARTTIKHGDVVAFRRKEGDDQRLFLKRVVGLPGESVAVRNGSVLVNEVPISEAYAAVPDHSNLAARIVPSETVFVMGDNRADSDDSRSFGPIPTASIVGKAVLIIWPLSRVRRIH